MNTIGTIALCALISGSAWADAPKVKVKRARQDAVSGRVAYLAKYKVQPSVHRRVKISGSSAEGYRILIKQRVKPMLDAQSYVPAGDGCGRTRIGDFDVQMFVKADNTTVDFEVDTHRSTAGVILSQRQWVHQYDRDLRQTLSPTVVVTENGFRSERRLKDRGYVTRGELVYDSQFDADRRQTLEALAALESCPLGLSTKQTSTQLIEAINRLTRAPLP
ncbi:MAG: hypothetical protein H6707_18855 [Deltaproteobacteria bacterium]|nr:hypothetical protein [Deltaproteobacteria bacterium]